MGITAAIITTRIMGSPIFHFTRAIMRLIRLAYSYPNPAVTYTRHRLLRQHRASTAPAQAPVIINNYNYYNTSPQAGVNAMFGR